MKKITAIILTVVMLLSLHTTVFAISNGNNEAEATNLLSNITTNKEDLGLEVKGAVLMEASTGRILYSENQFTELPLASVTKIMTLLLVCEALERGSFTLEDKVSISAYAASMGGSQVFLEEGERMSVEELIKCAVIASANDAAVALSELVSGSEAAFVKAMNQRAVELGLSNTHFENTTGLDDTVNEHYSSARDIAVMSRELIKHDIILKYSGVWQDTIRNGEFTLTNTNRLVRYYDGCNGLKTGSTDKAGYCVSATAKRGNMQLIAVIMGAETRDKRNEAARMLLDFGFRSYTLYEKGEEFLEDCDVLYGKSPTVALYSRSVSFIVKKDKLGAIEEIYEIPESLSAPISEGDAVGRIVYKLDGEILSECEIFAKEDIKKITLGDIFLRILKRIVSG